jgi:polo-like kinase 1
MKIKDIKERRKSICGTANYIAPEMIDKECKQVFKGHSFEVDIWAFGVCIY